RGRFERCSRLVSTGPEFSGAARSPWTDAVSVCACAAPARLRIFMESKMNFESLQLAPELMRALTTCGYTSPTPIQQQTIPALLAGRDVIGSAQTGTGKTAAFVLPALQRLAAARGTARSGHHAVSSPRVLVLAPTR